uniref:Uncharacterized protein n=1 Tax=Arundo donax TaxID=35708 RepID=A0A0A8YCU0_ARUDO
MLKQSKIILACMILRNFIQENALRDNDFNILEQDENYVPISEASTSQQSGTNNYIGDEDANMNAFLIQ